MGGGETTGLVMLVEWMSGLGMTSFFVLILVGGYKQWWVWGWQLREMKAERDYWRAQSMGVTSIAERAAKP